MPHFINQPIHQSNHPTPSSTPVRFSLIDLPRFIYGYAFIALDPILNPAGTNVSTYRYDTLMIISINIVHSSIHMELTRFVQANPSSSTAYSNRGPGPLYSLVLDSSTAHLPSSAMGVPHPPSQIPGTSFKTFAPHLLA
ncbi:hypothetical protein K443DRAFT_170701 [Laccaria amethystina LaAM-08-1]|uniref:Uncharacterized protein n=1 Tax=Laccaria amethystina LaAM-08-1 TaxID=1095629 RepID=A0A0C9WP10_9AGAR|nr:hypothetical protein K443DRAFT_170701 [Laccaria amethystina LaAM-08-1]